MVISVNCKDNSTSSKKEDVEITASIVIEPETIRTFVPEEIEIEVSINKTPFNANLDLIWSAEPSDIVEIGSSGNIKILDIGYTQIIAGLYDNSNNLIASDTVELYSGAKKVFNAKGVIKDIYYKNPENEILAISNDPGSTNSNEFLVSNDNGDNWIEIKSVPSDYNLINVSRSETNSNNIVSQYWDPNFSRTGLESTGIIQSKNNGETWTEITHPFQEVEGERFGYIYGIEYSPKLENTLFALTGILSDDWKDRLYVSNDNGISWEIVEDFEYSAASNPSLFMDYSNSNIFYINIKPQPGVEFGGYVTKNKGLSWKRWGEKRRQDILFINNEGVLFGIDYSGSFDILIFSEDNGSSWEVIFEEEKLSLVDFYSTGDVYLALLNNDTNGGHIIKYSIDKGQTWDIFSLAFNDRKTFNRPKIINILSLEDDNVELLCTWGGYINDDEGEIWKLKIFFSR